MKRIFKYEITRPAMGKVQLPKGAEIISARYQSSDYGEGFMLWALVDPQETTHETRFFDVCPTGSQVDPGAKFIATVEQQSSGLIFHVFETPAAP